MDPNKQLEPWKVETYAGKRINEWMRKQNCLTENNGVPWIEHHLWPRRNSKWLAHCYLKYKLNRNEKMNYSVQRRVKLYLLLWFRRKRFTVADLNEPSRGIIGMRKQMNEMGEIVNTMPVILLILITHMTEKLKTYYFVAYMWQYHAFMHTL